MIENIILTIVIASINQIVREMLQIPMNDNEINSNMVSIPYQEHMDVMLKQLTREVSEESFYDSVNENQTDSKLLQQICKIYVLRSKLVNH